MRNLEKVNKLDVAIVHEKLAEADRWLDAVKGMLYSVELNGTADSDCNFIYSVQKWIETKQKFLLTMNDMTDDDVVDLLNPEEP